jgi:hypothetical protein
MNSKEGQEVEIRLTASPDTEMLPESFQKVKKPRPNSFALIRGV